MANPELQPGREFISVSSEIVDRMRMVLELIATTDTFDDEERENILAGLTPENMVDAALEGFIDSVSAELDKNLSE